MLLQMSLCGAQEITLGSMRTLRNISIPTVRELPADGDGQRPQRVLSATERTLGYVKGDSITTRGVYVGKAGTFKVGAIITPATLSDYAGCKIVGMRFALSQSIGKSSAFLYNIVDSKASELVSSTVRRTAEGWNEVRFNTAQEYTITGSEQLLFGFAYNETEDMVADKAGALCFDVSSAVNDNASLIEKEGAFYNIYGLGNLCVQLILDVSNLPAKAVQLQNLMTGNKYHKPGEQIDGFVMYSNTGLEAINSVRIGYSIDNEEPQYIDHTEAVASGATGSVEQVFALPQNLSSGDHKIKFFVDKIDGETPAEDAASMIYNDIVVYTQSLPRQKHYVEQYNSQQSYQSALVNEDMSGENSKDNICLVNIYRENEPLNDPSSDYLFGLYAYTYPCFTIDRFYFMSEPYVAFDVNDFIMIMPDIAAQSVELLAAEADKNPSFASIDLKPTFNDASRKLTVTVSGNVVDEYPSVLGNLGITLMLTEDNVKSTQQVLNGNTVVTDNNYIHNQVFRTYLTSSVGDKVNIVDGKYETTYNFTLPENWKADDMRVVALATRYFDTVDDSNFLEADVTNAMSTTLNGKVNAIESVEASAADNASDGVYTIDGMKVGDGKLPSGIFVVRKDGKTHKVVIK